MDIVMARQAREAGCKHCVWYEPTVTVGGLQEYGTCHVSPPRTSSQQQWPIVMGTKWCSAWLPVSDYKP